MRPRAHALGYSKRLSALIDAPKLTKYKKTLYITVKKITMFQKKGNDVFPETSLPFLNINYSALNASEGATFDALYAGYQTPRIIITARTNQVITETSTKRSNGDSAEDAETISA